MYSDNYTQQTYTRAHCDKDVKNYAYTTVPMQRRNVLGFRSTHLQSRENDTASQAEHTSDALRGAEAWLDGAPAEVVETTQRLLAQVTAMREREIIYPAQKRVLAALAATSPAHVRVVILGQDPYHESGQAMGLAFSVPKGERLPPSLRNIYKEMAADLGCEMPASGDLTAWTEQGVLLLNTTLTVREHAANSHAKLGWQTLTSYVIRQTMTLPQPIVYLAWGRHAIGLVEDAMDDARACGDLAGEKVVLASTHPSPLSANRPSGGLPAFMGSRPFSRANEILVESGSEPVVWTAVAR